MTDAFEKADPDEMVWLRDLDGTGSMHVCRPHDPGAIRYVREDLAFRLSPSKGSPHDAG